MSTKKKSFLLHIDSLDILDDLTNGQAGVLFKAIKAYQKDEEFNLDSIVKIAFSPFKNQFARDNVKYEILCEKNRLIAVNRHKPKSTSGTSGNDTTPSVTKSTDNKNDSKKDNDSDSDKEVTKDNTSFVNDGFDHWWLSYPKKADKKKSLQKFKVITKGFNDKDFMDFVNMLTKDCGKRFANTEKSFIPNATTYLNGERWNDEY